MVCPSLRPSGSSYTRVRKFRFRLVGIWMVSRAREDGLKGNVTGFIILVSIRSCGDSMRARKRVCGRRRACEEKKECIGATYLLFSGQGFDKGLHEWFV